MAADPSDDAQTRSTAEATDSTSQQPASSHKRRRSGSVAGSDGRRHSASPSEDKAAVSSADTGTPAGSNPPLPDEQAPPLPQEAAPQDDGWEPVWDNNAQAYYFYNRFTGLSQWENPRVPEPSVASYGSYDRFASNVKICLYLLTLIPL